MYFADSMIMASLGSSVPEETLICLSITNIGNRSVIIQQWGFDYYNNNGHALVGINQSPLTLAMNPKLPCELKIENKIDLYLEKKYFIRNLQEGVEKKKLNPKLRLTLFAADSTGKVYRIKSSKTIAEMLR